MVTPKNSEYSIYVDKRLQMKTMKNKLLQTSGIKLELVLENVYDKPKLQTVKTVVSFPYDGEMAASQMRVKMRNINNSQRIAVPTMQKNSALPHPLLSPWFD